MCVCCYENKPVHRLANNFHKDSPGIRASTWGDPGRPRVTQGDPGSHEPMVVGLLAWGTGAPCWARPRIMDMCVCWYDNTSVHRSAHVSLSLGALQVVVEMLSYLS